MKKFSFFCLFLFLCAGCVSAASSAVDAANRKTAVRCLKLSEAYLFSNDYENALAQSEAGLSYDDTVADLWYVMAASKSASGASRAEVIPLVVRALTEGEWVDYNRDGARILYSDLLCDTGEYSQAVSVLDSEPFLYSSDAEYVRTKAYYRMNDAENIEKARRKVNAARKIYSSDMRFPRLFFKYEYCLKNRLSGTVDSELVQKIADSFIAKMPEYDNPDAELEIYAALFSSGENQLRMLRAFSAHGMEHPLYAAVALKTGLMTQQEAWDYFCSFADKSVNIQMAEDILSLITDDITVQSVREHFNAYGGELSADTNNDGEDELFIRYMRGRPVSFSWDKDNDGIIEWSGKCDFGVPERIKLTEGNLELTYGIYPAVVRVVCRSDKNPQNNLLFNIPDEVLKWSPCIIEPLASVKKLTGLDFFVVKPVLPSVPFDEGLLVKNCSSYEIPTKERQGGVIKFSVLDGVVMSADYYSDGTLYAHTEFKDGLPVIRTVDNDADGIFETTETIGFDPENVMNTAVPEQNQVMANLFGLPVSGGGLYVKMIQIDQNGDTVPDFSEEYLENGGKVCSWDFNGDGNWDLRYKKYPRKDENAPVVEDSQFYRIPSHSLVTVTLWNGEPVKVVSENESYSVTQGAFESFYWVGAEGSADDEYYVMNNITSSVRQGESFILENNSVRMLVVKIGDNIYAQVLPETHKD